MMALRGLFIVGTDTGVGKTYMASRIARSLVRGGRRVGVLKPLATGGTCSQGVWRLEDTEQLIAAVGEEIPFHRVTPLRFEEPLAPAVAARRSGSPLSFETVRLAVEEALAWWAARVEVMIVEGVGGLLTPLTEEATLADLAILLDYPLVLVARRTLGTLNHTLLTVESARSRGLRVAGIILNSPACEDMTAAEATNAEELSRRVGAIPLLGEQEFQPDASGLSIADDPDDWYDRASAPRGEVGPGGLGLWSSVRGV